MALEFNLLFIRDIRVSLVAIRGFFCLILNIAKKQDLVALYHRDHEGET
jgi:hypothetical protein